MRDWLCVFPEGQAMFASRVLAIGTVFLILVEADVARAQAPPPGFARPLSSTGGYASDEMRRIYRSGIGTGYSIADIARINDASLRVNVPNVGQSSSPRLSLGAGGGGGFGKPFSNFSPAPTVSPYMNLFRDDFEGNDDFNYQTLVRPMLEQQRVNEQLQRQSFDLARRLQSISAQPDFNPEGNVNMMPTGHQTVFQYYGRFYPQMGGRQRR
jgi:hypothetical protein